MKLASTSVRVSAWMQLKEQLFLFLVFNFTSVKKNKKNETGNSLHKVPQSSNILSEIFFFFCLS